jgi:hypothetical protein
MANKRGPKAPPTPEHLAALAQGRTEGKAVREYMQALGNQTKRTRGRSPKSAADIQAEIDATDDPLERIKLRPILRQAQLREALVNQDDMEELQAAFVKVVVSYSERHGLTYGDWRTEGVPASVLKEAGFSRGQ